MKAEKTLDEKLSDALKGFGFGPEQIALSDEAQKKALYVKHLEFLKTKTNPYK